MSRNIVLVTVDSLRADHCSHWGYERETTPTLDRIAENGLVFENAIAPGPKTPESMPAIFTGSFPTAELTSSELGSWHDQILPHMQARETIAERFSRRGYTTGAFTPNGFTSGYFGFDAGFDHFDDFVEDDFRPGFEVPNVIRGAVKMLRREGNWKLWENYYDRITRFVEEASEPYFLWVFLLDVHSPYLVPRRYRTENSWLEMMYANWKRSDTPKGESVRRRLVSAYDDTIRYTDDFFDKLLDDIGHTDPVIVVHSDHGEAFGEHGLMGHQKLLYEENVHVPLVVGNVATSASIDSPVSLCRLPDVLDVVRRSNDSDLDAELRSVTRAGDDPVVFRSAEGNRLGVRIGRFKLVSRGEQSSLYDLEHDPEETRDVSAEYPDVKETLKAVNRKQIAANDETRTITEQASDLVSNQSYMDGL